MPEYIDATAQKFLSDLGKDLREAAKSLTSKEARFLVDSYYLHQENRKRLGNQKRAMTKAGEPVKIIDMMYEVEEVLESRIKSALNHYAKGHPMGWWALEQHGIGPVISAGLIAHVDITRCPKVTSLWTFAGVNPAKKWGKGQKRPHNGKLKTLVWHIGECIKRTKGSEKSFYGPLWEQRKAYEVRKNDAGENSEQAERQLREKSYSKDTDAYRHLTEGKLPPAQVDLRASRWTAKLFLSHWWEMYYMMAYPTLNAPRPWVLVHGGHVDYIAPPTPGIETLREKFPDFRIEESRGT